MIVVGIIACIVISMLVVVGMGTAAMRRKNAEIDRLRRQKPIPDKRWRALNVIDRCDYSAGCHARSHETGCVRGRADAQASNNQHERNQP